MEEKKRSAKFLKQRKFLMVLPLLVLPFVVIFFMALGGGRGSGPDADQIAQAGLNLRLPDAQFKNEKAKDKLGLYEEANKDSIKLKEAMKNDPYYHKENSLRLENKPNALENIFQSSAKKYDLNSNISSENSADKNEKELMEKISLLKNAINKPASKQQPDFIPGAPANKLESMMSAISHKNEADPEINQLNHMLDKIMMVQHPETVQDSMRKLSEKNKQQTFVVSTKQNEVPVSLFDAGENADRQNEFYDLNDEAPENEKQNAIEAVISETQTLVSGATIKLRLSDDIYLHGFKISKDQFVFGTATMNNERLKIIINSVRYENNILPVSLEAYDLDGMAGIYIPGSISRDASKESANEAISNIGITSLDPSLGAQAANAGIQTAKALLSKKVKLIQVTIRAGYKVLLKDNNQK